MNAETIKPQPWIEVTSRLPRRAGWYAVQDSTVEEEWYIDAYWENGSWWKFGRHAGLLNVRQEVKDVLRWRFMDDIARQDIRAACKDAIIPRGPEPIKKAFAKRLFCLHALSVNRWSRKMLIDNLGWPRKTADTVLADLGGFGVILGTDSREFLYVIDYGPFNKEWLVDNADRFSNKPVTGTGVKHDLA